MAWILQDINETYLQFAALEERLLHVNCVVYKIEYRLFCFNTHPPVRCHRLSILHIYCTAKPGGGAGANQT